MLPSLPMTLTLSRIIAIPVVVVLLYVEGDMARYAACAVYAAAAVTDYLDGYLARMWQQQSKLGRILDPIADKLLVAATLLTLVAVDRITGWTVLPTLVILCREVLVSGLREFLAEINAHNLPVTRLAKWKTAMQMTALGFLIVGDAAPTADLPITLIGELGLWIAAVLTLITGYDYLAEGLKHVAEDNAPKPAESGHEKPKPARPIL